jgi:hypothetical protein
VKEPGPLSTVDLAAQWRTPLGYRPSYARFMKVLRHLGLSNQEAVTEDGQAKIEAELLSRQWTRVVNASLEAKRLGIDIARVTADLLDLGKQQLFWQQLEVQVLVLGGDHARARAVVEHLTTTTRCSQDRAKEIVLDALKHGRELTVHPGE